MQYLLDRAVWSSEQLREVVCTYVREQLGDASAVLVIDETGFLKKGSKSVGVQRQYRGTAGRVENCQLGVFLTSASQAGHTFLDRELYLPKSWTQDAARCREAHVPAEVSLATKPELAARMLARTLNGGISAAWVTGDTVSGSHRPLRAVLAARQQAYALAVPRREQVQVQAESVPRRVDQVARGLPAEAWQALSAGSGSKGPRLFDWARVELVEAEPARAGWQHWLVIRRGLASGAQPAKMASVLVFARTGTTLPDMVQAIGSRWTVEQCLEEAKGQVDIDHARSQCGGGISRSRGLFHRLFDRTRLRRWRRSDVQCFTEKVFGCLGITCRTQEKRKPCSLLNPLLDRGTSTLS
jgi:SRSO17 transposase